jgi:hypothetical protein
MFTVRKKSERKHVTHEYMLYTIEGTTTTTINYTLTEVEENVVSIYYIYHLS